MIKVFFENNSFSPYIIKEPNDFSASDLKDAKKAEECLEAFAFWHYRAESYEKEIKRLITVIKKLRHENNEEEE